jgi:hypothetical protein
MPTEILERSHWAKSNDGGTNVIAPRVTGYVELGAGLPTFAFTYLKTNERTT